MSAGRLTPGNRIQMNYCLTVSFIKSCQIQLLLLLLTLLTLINETNLCRIAAKRRPASNEARRSVCLISLIGRRGRTTRCRRREFIPRYTSIIGGNRRHLQVMRVSTDCQCQSSSRCKGAMTCPPACIC